MLDLISFQFPIDIPDIRQNRRGLNIYYRGVFRSLSNTYDRAFFENS